MRYNPRSLPSSSQNSLRRKANNSPLAPQQSNGNAQRPSDPTQRELGERLSRNGTPSSTKVPSVLDSSYLSPPKGGKFRPSLSDKSRSGSEADSLLDLYGHPRSVAEGTEKSERGVTLEDLYLDEEDPENSRWIHRDKLAMIESHEMEEAGIKLPKQRRSKNSLRHEKSHSRNQSTTSLKEQGPDGFATRADRRQKVRSPVRQHVQDNPTDFDLRTPQEIASKIPAERGTSAMYNQPNLGKSGSKIPLPKTSPLPINQGHIDRSTPLPRQRGASRNSLRGDEEGFSYNRIRSRSNSIGSRTLLDDHEVNGTPTPISRPNGPDGSPGSPPKPRVVSKAASVNHARPRTSNGPRNITDPQKLRSSPSTHRSSPGFPRPRSRNGLEARPATAVNRPEGEAPWLADMYKPDPRLPPEEQMLPTHAKRLQQEQRERELKAAGLSPQQQQPTTADHTPERPVGITRTPSPAAPNNQFQQQPYDSRQSYQPATPKYHFQQQPYDSRQQYQNHDPRRGEYPPPERTLQHPSSPAGGGGGNQWPTNGSPHQTSYALTLLPQQHQRDQPHRK